MSCDVRKMKITLYIKWNSWCWFGGIIIIIPLTLVPWGYAKRNRETKRGVLCIVWDGDCSEWMKNQMVVFICTEGRNTWKANKGVGHARNLFLGER